MKTIDVTRKTDRLWLGRDSENNFRPVGFDCFKWLEKYDNATIAVYYQPSGSEDPYPVSVQMDGTTAVWHPTETELVEGEGELQIALFSNGVIGTSAIIPCKVDRSLISSTAHPPDTAPSWTISVVEDVTEQANRAEAAAERAEQAAGDIDEDAIADAVANYLEENPVTVTETDPTVPAWAKQPTKPSYTAADVGALPASTVIPPAVTEQTVSGWGFTKNTGTYSKPSGGIPKTDLAPDVQTSLGKADTALQEHQSLSGYATEQWVNQKGYGTYSKPSGGIPASDLASGVIPNVSGKLDTNQGAANAGKFMVVGSDGNVAPVTMTAWQGGTY